MGGSAAGEANCICSSNSFGEFCLPNLGHVHEPLAPVGLVKFVLLRVTVDLSEVQLGRVPDTGSHAIKDREDSTS